MTSHKGLWLHLYICYENIKNASYFEKSEREILVKYSFTNFSNYCAMSQIRQTQPSLQHSDHHLLNIIHLHLFMHIFQPLHTSIHLGYIQCLVSLWTKDFLPVIVLPMIPPATLIPIIPHDSLLSFLKYSVPSSCPIITLLCHHLLTNSPKLHLPAE